MAEQSNARQIEAAIAQEAGLNVIVEARGGSLVLDGVVDSAEDRQAAEDIAARFAGSLSIENNLDIEDVTPTSSSRFASDATTADLSWTDRLADPEIEVEPDLIDQELLDNPAAAAGATGSMDDDKAGSGDEVWVPPSDPVLRIDQHGEAQVLGGFAQDSLDDVSVDPSAQDRRPGDEALADAISRELAEDAATADLRIRVIVREGVAHLHGHVAGPEDAESAEEVAARVPGVIEVREELQIESDRGA